MSASEIIGRLCRRAKRLVAAALAAILALRAEVTSPTLSCSNDGVRPDRPASPARPNLPVRAPPAGGRKPADRRSPTPRARTDRPRPSSPSAMARRGRWPFMPCSSPRSRRRAEMDRLGADPHLRHARLGPEHRGRSRRPARSRLRRLLRRRRLSPTRCCWRRPFGLVLDLPACRRRPGGPGASCSAFPCCACGGDYLAIVTLAFGEIIRLVLMNWLTTATLASPSIPRLTFFGLPFVARPGGFRPLLRHRVLAAPPADLPPYVILVLALLTNS